MVPELILYLGNHRLSNLFLRRADDTSYNFTTILHFQLLIILFTMICGGGTYAATTMKRYFAHEAVEDKYGVIAPWYNGLNGQCYFRIRIAAETLKRYPWTDPNKDIVGLPTYMVNGRWYQAASDQPIRVIPLEADLENWPYGKHWANGDYGQRTFYVLTALVDYYRYSGGYVTV